MTEFDRILDGVGKDWNYKWFNRLWSLESKHKQIEHHLTEYKSGGKSVLDISCGNGSLLELMRYYGNDIQGVERPGSPLHALLKSQDIPFIRHDCGNTPYPFDDKSYDLVVCCGAIELYGIDWSIVVDELFRISRECVFLIANRGPVLEANKHTLINYQRYGWEKVSNPEDYSLHKWSACA